MDCHLFLPKVTADTNANHRWGGDCTDCEYYYVGYQDFGKKLKLVESMTWKSAQIGLVSTGIVLLATMLTF